MAPVFNIGVLVYPGADILDFCGPLEIFTTNPPGSNERPFNTTTFACQNPVKVGADTMTLVPDASIQDIDSKLEEYDILIVPGAMPQIITDQLSTKEGQDINALLKKFATLPPRNETGHRIVQSVCSGAMILAASGILANKTVTTHHMCYDMVKELADQAAGGESGTKVEKKRWVDAGLTDAGVRIVNAGGVTSGIDASLYVVEMLIGKEGAKWTADVVEFERRNQEDGWVA